MPIPKRIGLVVPSSNTTMETETPAMLRQRHGMDETPATFHSSRARLPTVDAESLARIGAALSGAGLS
jgi:maleate isomerase